MNNLTIFHYGDIQIELRVSGEGSQRFDEFKAVLEKTENLISEKRPELVIIPGDIYQFAITEGEEQEMFSEHLHKILPFTQRVIIIAGNHDIKQRNNGLIKEGHKINTGDSISSVVRAINNEKISYYKHTGVYEDSKFPIAWVVWSQIDKHSALEPKPDYNPWVNNDFDKLKNKGLSIIELYHDPITGAKGFDGKPTEHFSEYGVGLKDFKANTIIAADIHAPEIIRFGDNNERIFTYCSSLVQRNFGEGNYYSNEKLTVDGNSQHGLNIIEFNIDKDIVENIEFVKIQNPVSRHTIHLSNDFDYSDVSIELVTRNLEHTTSNKIRLVCQTDRQKFAENEQKFIDAFNKNLSDKHIELEFMYSKDIMGVELANEQFDDFDEILDKNKIIEISQKYISDLVDKTSMIDKDDKDEAKKYIQDIFTTEFSKHDLVNDINRVNLISADIDNFMNFGETSVRFDKNNKITKISGTNGVGKTKIFSFINWMLHDRIDINQDTRNKKYNYSLYFNDSSEKDEVFGKLILQINNKYVEIEKTLKREWKRNSKDITNSDWVNNLKGVPNVELVINITENAIETKKTGDEAFEFLTEYFNFEDVNEILFVDSYVLKNLIKTPSEDLISKILKSMGIDITNDLLSTFETVKSEKLNNLSKPSDKKEDVLSLIESKELDFNKSKENIENFEHTLSQKKDDRDRVESEIKKLRGSLHPVETVELINQEIHRLTEQIQDKNSDRTSNLELQKQTKEKLIVFENIETELNSERNNLELQNNKISTLNSDKHTLELEKGDVSKKVLERVNEIKEIINSERLQDTKTILNHKEQISILNESVNELKAKYVDELNKVKKVNDEVIEKYNKDITEGQSKITTIEKAIMSLEFGISSYLGRISDNEKEIESLKNSTICEYCGSTLDPNKPEDSEKLEKINSKIEELERTTSELRVSITESELNIEKYRVGLDKLNESQSEFNKLISDIKNTNSEIELLIVSDVQLNDYFDVSESIQKINSVKVEIKNYQDKISEIENSSNDEIWNEKIKTQVSSDELIKTLKSELDSFTQKISDKQAEIETANQHKSTINNKISELELKQLEKTELENKLNTLDKYFTNFESDIKNIESLIETQKTKIPLAELNEKTKENIQKFEDILIGVQKEYETLLLEKEGMLNLDKNIEKEISDLKLKLEEIRVYKMVESSLKLYKQLLGKKGLPQYIFSTLLNLINNKLNESLENVNFRLIFDEETLELRFIDLEKGVSRPVQFISGMQETTVGLAMIKLNLLLNRSLKFNLIFIDEISGKVTDGQQLTYKSKNYKQILKDFIEDMSNDIQVYIVDHVLNYEDERIIEVQPSNEGSIITELV